ncbi:MAG: hypothetical protein Fur006_62250 [Coleofasciculaceae cyanobacterium]
MTKFGSILFLLGRSEVLPRATYRLLAVGGAKLRMETADIAAECGTVEISHQIAIG